MGDITLPLCDINPCGERNYHCNPNFTELSGISGNKVVTGVAGDCTVFIEDSDFTTVIVANVAPNENVAGTTQARLHNVTIANGKLGSVLLIQLLYLQIAQLKTTVNQHFTPAHLE